MPHQHIHYVHLAMAGTRIAAATIDLFHDDRSLGQTQARAAIVGRNEGSQPTGARQRSDECLGIASLGVNFPEILVRKLGT